ncbi:MAG: CHAP domain-containing protein [Bifidobacterium crudilactis]|jgi:surface antigen|nr:CHAP domain-containing protein [Bifidobacterium crudilactis]
MMTRHALLRRGILAVVLSLVATLSACSPSDVLAYLAGCPQQQSSSASADAAVASPTGEWSSLVGLNMSQVSGLWPEHTDYCSSYDYGFQCTWWACMRQRALGHTISMQMGNGGDWDSSAQQLGWSQGAAVGGIASFNPGSAGSSAIYGHVAVIEQVTGDTVHISEGGTGFGVVHTRTFSASNPPLGVTYWHPTDSGLSAETVASPPLQQSTLSAAFTCKTTSAGTVNVVDYDGDGIHASPEQAQAIARKLMSVSYPDWNETDWQALIWIWNHESGWRWDADNPTSDAYGIPQSLPGSKMASAGADWKDNAATQITWGLGYIAGRYGSPSNAKTFWLSHNWY